MTQSATDRWLGVPEGLTREEWWESQTPANFLEGESPGGDTATVRSDTRTTRVQGVVRGDARGGEAFS